MYKFVRAISLFYIYVFNRVKVTGKENIPTDGALIICANHHSVFDILLLLTAFKRRIIFMAKQELFKIPVMSFFLKRLNAISVDRSGMPISAVRGALKALKNGEQLGIFPEGTRYNTGDGSDARGGVAMFSYKCKAPIVPIHLVYKRNVNFFNRYEIRIGKPIIPEELGIEKGSSEEYTQAGEHIMETVYGL